MYLVLTCVIKPPKGIFNRFGITNIQEGNVDEVTHVDFLIHIQLHFRVIPKNMHHIIVGLVLECSQEFSTIFPIVQ